MVNLRLQSILASMAKYYWILHYLSLLLSRLKHSFICKGVIGQNADIHFVFCPIMISVSAKKCFCTKKEDTCSIIQLPKKAVMQ